MAEPLMLQNKYRLLCYKPYESALLLEEPCFTPRDGRKYATDSRLQCLSNKAKVELGLLCDHNSVCLGGSTCQNGFCLCNPGYVAENGRCVSVKIHQVLVLPGSMCHEPGAICSGGSKCENGWCVCGPNYVIKLHVCVLAEILPPYYALPGSDCGPRERQQCAGGSFCVMHKCVCPAGMIAKQGQCVVSPIIVNPGSLCDDSCSWCFLTCGGGSTCFNGACVCPKGQTIQNDQCVTVKSTGTVIVVAMMASIGCGSRLIVVLAVIRVVLVVTVIVVAIRVAGIVMAIK
uniref:EGF-like domain-containing protein n=1 Tax=Romanomermis culicivorax TaxID=13658 RepID=A0A915HJ65_ROMCU